MHVKALQPCDRKPIGCLAFGTNPKNPIARLVVVPGGDVHLARYDDEGWDCLHSCSGPLDHYSPLKIA